MSEDPDRCSSPCEEVRELYTDLALHPGKDFGWGKGKDNARSLGYDPDWPKRLPEEVWESSAAVGNPFALGPIHPGETVVDLGCGAGADVCVAALLVGDQGHVVGVDITPAMVERARTNAVQAGLDHVDIREADIAKLPLPDASADVVISNGSINLSPNKPCVLKEVLRVLKPGGRLQIADMVRDESQESCGPDPAGSWADCVAGTVAPACLLKMIEEAGFVRAQLAGMTGYRTSSSTIGALFYAEKPRVVGVPLERE